MLVWGMDFNEIFVRIACGFMDSCILRSLDENHGSLNLYGEMFVLLFSVPATYASQLSLPACGLTTVAMTANWNLVVPSIQLLQSTLRQWNHW